MARVAAACASPSARVASASARRRPFSASPRLMPSIASASASAARRPFSASPLSLGLLRLGLRRGDGRGLARVGRRDLGGTAGLGLLLDAVALGVRGLADLGLESALGQRGLLDGDLLLLGQDRLVPLGLRERAGGGGLGCGGVGLGLDLGLLERQRALGDGDLLLRGDLGLLGGLPGVGLRDPRGLAGPGGLGTAEVGEVSCRRR
ncbi:hypothetical protein [Nocardioides convexus]|uniref:hypothetical protein n=1 Tax=Nocardioides convexus TaxID=2712224 RepID=UPI00241872A5|nr:hypothetical protein [Nocardioides convexus]